MEEVRSLVKATAGVVRQASQLTAQKAQEHLNETLLGETPRSKSPVPGQLKRSSSRKMGLGIDIASKAGDAPTPLHISSSKQKSLRNLLKQHSNSTRKLSTQPSMADVAVPDGQQHDALDQSVSRIAGALLSESHRGTSDAHQQSGSQQHLGGFTPMFALMQGAHGPGAVSRDSLGRGVVGLLCGHWRPKQLVLSLLRRLGGRSRLSSALNSGARTPFSQRTRGLQQRSGGPGTAADAAVRAAGDPTHRDAAVAVLSRALGLATELSTQGCWRMLGSFVTVGRGIRPTATKETGPAVLPITVVTRGRKPSSRADPNAASKRTMEALQASKAFGEAAAALEGPGSHVKSSGAFWQDEEEEDGSDSPDIGTPTTPFTRKKLFGGSVRANSPSALMPSFALSRPPSPEAGDTSVLSGRRPRRGHVSFAAGADQTNERPVLSPGRSGLNWVTQPATRNEVAQNNMIADVVRARAAASALNRHGSQHVGVIASHRSQHLDFLPGVAILAERWLEQVGMLQQWQDEQI